MIARMPGMTFETARIGGGSLDVSPTDPGASRIRLVGFALVLGTGTVLNAMGVRGGNARKEEGAYELMLVSPPPVDVLARVVRLGGGSELSATVEGSTVSVTAPGDTPFLLLVTAPVPTSASAATSSAPLAASPALPSASPTEPNHGS